jgi:hypothetical protein
LLGDGRRLIGVAMELGDGTEAAQDQLGSGSRKCSRRSEANM